MSTINNDYSRFYTGTENLKAYGPDNALKKDTLVRYELNTTDEHGNKIMDKMSREETLQAMKEISAQYGENVIVQFSGDGLVALTESKKGMADRELSEEEIAAREAKNVAFRDSIVQFEKGTLNHLPAYSGMYEADKTIAAALENCTKEEQAFVYDIIRQNFLVGNSGSVTEEERQANIALGMKKAEYAADNFISEDGREAFLEAMENIAKLASAGKSDHNGNMDYGVRRAHYLGHGSDIVCTTDPEDMMRRMDSAAYKEYQRIRNESSNADGVKNSLRYLSNWYAEALKKNPNIVNEYEQQSEKYIEENVKNQKLNTTFKDIKTDSKEAFLESLRVFQINNPGFLSSFISRELSLPFWSR